MQYFQRLYCIFVRSFKCFGILFMDKSSSSLVAWRYFDLIFQSLFDLNEEVAGKKLNETSRRMTSGKEIFVVGNRKCRRLKSSHEVDM